MDILVTGVLLLALVAASASERTVPAKRYAIDLDLEPLDRWKDVASDHSADLRALFKQVKAMVPAEVAGLASVIGDDIGLYFPYPYSSEIISIASSAGVPIGDVVLGNIIYEATAYARGPFGKMCTSIVAETNNGTIYHARNLDYAFSDLLRNMTIIADFQRAGKTVYTGTCFVGYVGLLTAQKPNGFTITLNERDQGDWWMNAVEAVLAGTHGVAGLLIRDLVADPAMDFDNAVVSLVSKPLIAPSYIIIGGVRPRQGVVITRDRIAALDLWRINAEDGRWYVVETNYDHWQPPPASDDRRHPAIKAMEAMGRSGISVASLFGVISTPPVLNDGTTYSVVMSAALPEVYNTWVRHPN